MTCIAHRIWDSVKAQLPSGRLNVVSAVCALGSCLAVRTDLSAADGCFSRYNGGSSAFEFRLLRRVTSRTHFPDMVEQQPLESV